MLIQLWPNKPQPMISMKIQNTVQTELENQVSLAISFSGLISHWALRSNDPDTFRLSRPHFQFAQKFLRAFVYTSPPPHEGVTSCFWIDSLVLSIPETQSHQPKVVWLVACPVFRVVPHSGDYLVAGSDGELYLQITLSDPDEFCLLDTSLFRVPETQNYMILEIRQESESPMTQSHPPWHSSDPGLWALAKPHACDICQHWLTQGDWVYQTLLSLKMKR